MLEILAHSDLTHELVLVPVHSSQSTDMREDVLQGVRELESVDISETELDVRVDDQLSETEDFTTKMESIAESRLLAFLGRQSFDGLQVHILESECGMLGNKIVLVGLQNSHNLDADSSSSKE